MIYIIVNVKEFKNNDIYFMEVLSNKIIINNNYDGILIYNNNLELLKKINIFKDMMIYCSFKNNDEILLFCPDNKCLVYINIISYKYKIININNSLENIIFSPLYKWNESDVILKTYAGEFYRVCLKKYNITNISYKNIEKKYHDLTEISTSIPLNKIIKTFLHEHVVIIRDEGEVVVVNIKNKTKQIFENIEICFLDIDYNENSLFLINENIIEIIINEKQQKIYPLKNYIYLKGRIFRKLGEALFVTLSSCKSDIKCSRLEVIKI